MTATKTKFSTARHKFHLDKWYLDFVSETGEAGIYYIGRIRRYGLEAPYTSWLNYSEDKGMRQRARFRNINIPEVQGNRITWKDTIFELEGKWETSVSSLEARLFDSEDGFLDWKCIHPVSRVQIKMKDKTLVGTGYVEQLVLTAPPWKIPMYELRWGRFHSANTNVVWIEIRHEKSSKWLWLNGERMAECIIEDDCIIIPEKNISVVLDRNVVLEAEKKIFSVVTKMIRYIPGLNKIIPANFLLADECKWLSKGTIFKNERKQEEGIAIHELVNFNPMKQ